MNPRGLLVAYEETSIKPVVSDLDALLIGSRGVRFEPLPAEQLALIEWCCGQVEKILGTPSTRGWTGRWLEVLKSESDKGFRPTVPPYGFGDPTTYAIIKSVSQQLAVSGAVRHGAECCNFFFPQELDSQLLVMWEGFPKPPWRYVNQSELRRFLLARIDEGYAFPLNPKWVLCDEGWLPIFKRLLESAEAEAPMEAWFPASSGLRERILAIAKEHPRGFRPLPTEGDAKEHRADIDPALAEYMLRRHETLRRAKQKLRAINAMRGLGRRVGGSTKLMLPTRAAPTLPDASVAQPSRSPPPRVTTLAGRRPFRARMFSS